MYELHTMISLTTTKYLIFGISLKKNKLKRTIYFTKSLFFYTNIADYKKKQNKMRILFKYSFCSYKVHDNDILEDFERQRSYRNLL